MIAPDSSVSRWARALLVGTWASVGAATAHRAAGEAVPLVALVPVAAATVVAALLLAGRRLSLPLLWLLLALPQVAVHLLAGYLHGHPMAPSAAMLAAHVAGLTVVAIAIAKAEQLWWDTWARTTLAVRVLADVVVPAPATSVPPAPPSPRSHHLLEHVVVRRGPPTPESPAHPHRPASPRSSPMSHRRAFRPALLRPLGAACGALALVVLGSSAAQAHVTLTPSTTAAGSSAVLTFSVGHGCDGSPTTAVTVRMPSEIVAATPTVNPGWTVRKVMEELPSPVSNGHGGEYTERVSHIRYTARSPLEEGYRDTFEIALTLPESAGERLDFPVIQTCAEGETAWVQTAAEDEPEPELPAPGLVLTPAVEEAHGHGESAAPDGDGDGTTALGWIGLALGALGLAAGGTALVRTRR